MPNSDLSPRTLCKLGSFGLRVAVRGALGRMKLPTACVCADRPFAALRPFLILCWHQLLVILRYGMQGSIRVFKMEMRAIKVENVSGAALDGLQLIMELGGDYEEREVPGKGLVCSGKHGTVFKTSASGWIEDGTSWHLREHFGDNGAAYWIGSYLDLETQDLALGLWQASCAPRPMTCSPT